MPGDSPALVRIQPVGMGMGTGKVPGNRGHAASGIGR
jgi:hypothetical protein